MRLYPHVENVFIGLHELSASMEYTNQFIFFSRIRPDDGQVMRHDCDICFSNLATYNYVLPKTTAGRPVLCSYTSGFKRNNKTKDIMSYLFQLDLRIRTTQCTQTVRDKTRYQGLQSIKTRYFVCVYVCACLQHDVTETENWTT